MPTRLQTVTPPFAVKLKRLGWNEYGTFFNDTVTLESGIGLTLEDRIDSISTPSYETAKKFGHLPVNNHYRRLYKAAGSSKSTVFYDNRFGGITYTASADLIKNVSWPVKPTIDLTEINNELLAKVKGITWNAPVALMEAGKTADMIGDTAVRLASAFSSLKKGRLGDFGQILGLKTSTNRERRFNKAFGTNPNGAATSAWLEYSYGWVPLLGDIHSAANTLADRLHSPRLSVTTVKTSKKFTINKEFPGLRAPYGPYITVNGVCRTEASLTLGVSFSKDYSASAASAVGITNPALVAWEVVPYSFVIDWFIPVGDFLNSFDATVGMTFHSGYRYLKRKDVFTYSVSSLLGVGEPTGGGEFDDFVKERVKLSSFPAPVLPKPQLPSGFRKAASGLSLLYQAFGRR